MKRVIYSVLAVVIWSVIFGSLANGLRAEPRNSPTEYVVKAGETCKDIARKFGLTLQQLHDMNPQLGDIPVHSLVAGQKLRLTGLPEAQLKRVEPLVETRPPEQLAWQEGVEGQDLYRLYRVATREEGEAWVKFRDDTELHLRERSLIVIYGRMASAKGPPRTGAELVEGSLRGGLASLGGESNELEITTPSANIKAATSDLGLRVGADRTSRVAVYDGRAVTSAQSVSVEVPAGSGTLVEFGKAPRPAKLLPAAPVLSDGAKVTRLMRQGDRASHSIVWNAVSGADSYQLEVSTRPDFTKVFLRKLLPASVKTAVVTDLTPGRYYFRLAATDADGLDSNFSKAQEVVVVPFTIRGAMLRPDGSFWSPGEAWVSVEASPLRVTGRVDGNPIDPQLIHFRGASKHRIEIQVDEAGMKADFLTVELSDVKVEATLDRSQVGVSGGEIRLKVQVTDKSGTIVTMDGLNYRIPAISLRGLLSSQSDGTFQASLAIPASSVPRKLEIEVWLEHEKTPRWRSSVSQER